MKTPYEILGVRKNATGKSIQRAYRRLVMEHHPDRGGDAETFAEIHRAYEVLTDPLRRAEFDRSGNWGGVPRRTDLQEIASILAQYVNGLVAQIIDRKQDIEKVDLAAAVKQAIGKTQIRLREQERDQMVQVATWKKTMGRWINQDAEGILDAIARNNVAEMERRLEYISGELLKINRVADFMKDVGYRFEADPITRASWGSYTQISFVDFVNTYSKSNP